MTTATTYNALVNELNSMEHAAVPDGLDGLDSFQAVNAERRVNAHGSESRQRATVFASILGVNAERLAKYVGAMVRRVPAENRQSHQEDLEQAIWTHLLHRKAHVVGNWEVTKMVVRDAYKAWYSAYAEERQLAVDAERRAISLERAYAREHQQRPEGIGHDIRDDSWLGWEDTLVENVDATRLFANLPEAIRDMVERKANGEPQNAKERQRLSRWLRGGSSKRHPTAKTNSDTVKAILDGTHIGKVAWHKAIR